MRTTAYLSLALVALATHPAPGTANAVSLPGPAQFAATAPQPIRGTIRGPDGAPIAGANVFLLETLDGMVTGPDGRFDIATAPAGTVTLVVRRLGYRTVRLDLGPDERTGLDVVLEGEPTLLDPLTVRAGRYTTGAGRGDALTPVEVVSTPGTAADLNRTIQTLPGVQAVDEGTGLYVRGGDYIETHTLIDGAPYRTLQGHDQPAGTFVGTVDPFLLDGISFSSGAFGARHGDALSGLVDLRTRGLPTRPAAEASVGLAAVSALAALPVSSRLGIRAAANLTDTRLLFRLNDPPRDYPEPPHGHDLSGSVVWRYRPSSEVKAFAIQQRSSLGIGVDAPSYTGEYGLDGSSGLAVVNWRDAFGKVAPALTLSRSRLRRTEEFGAYRLVTRSDGVYAGAMVRWNALPGLELGAGVEWERVTTSFDGTIPEHHDARAPGARVRVANADVAGERTGLYAEAEWAATPHLDLDFGVRTDHATLTGRTTVDPRLAATFTLVPALALSAAWGIYHQVQDPLLFEDRTDSGGLRPMRATHGVVGLQLGGSDGVLRIEAYDKRYTDLARLGRDYETVAGGTGRSRGIDVFLKLTGPGGSTGRLTYSHGRARRTDPATGAHIPAPFDVPHTLTATAEVPFGDTWRVGVAWRSASGRPHTPIVDARYDAARAVWVSIYGPPASERLPGLRRLDASVYHIRPLGTRAQAVLFVAIQNLTDRANVYDYRYSSDYRTRRPVPSLFNRSIYIGASISTL